MHPSSLENMRKALSMIDAPANPIVLDVGGRNNSPKDRSYKTLFPNAKAYYVADIEDGPNVTHLMEDEYEIPEERDSVDIVVSGQTLEHVINPFRLVSEMKRILVPGGYMLLIAPSKGPNHDFRDCWRFMQDSFKGIAYECGLHFIKSWIYNGDNGEGRGNKWGDHTAIFQK